MKNKLSYIFILLHTLLSCQESSIINHLKLSNYSGNPKKVTEIKTFSNQEIDKSISYFDKDGFLTKIEYYNLTNSEYPNKRFLNKIIEYNSKEKTKRNFEAINPQNKKKESEGYFEKISDSLYKRVSNSNIYDSSLTKLLYFGKNNRLLKTEEIGTFNGNEINITIFFTYTNTIKNEMIIEDLINQKKSKFIYKNIKLDQNANSIYEELFDDNEIFQLKIEREFEYY